jgi:3-dehydroquinate dehydratase/shikimate dehydrogenase
LDFEIEDFANGLSRPTILTLRPSEQGGYRVLERPERETFWSRDWSLPANSAFDIEADLVESGLGKFDWPQVIVSHHDFDGVPDDLEEIYERLAATPAHIVKIAVRANDITDCIRIFHLLDRASNEQRELIAIAMGNPGIATRILGWRLFNLRFTRG